MGPCGRRLYRTTYSGPQVRSNGTGGGVGGEGARIGMRQVDCGGFSRRDDLEWSWEQRGTILTQTQFCFVPQTEVGGAGSHLCVLCLSQAWLWIITMNDCIGQTPSSQSLAASGSMAQTPSWLLTANEVSL